MNSAEGPRGRFNPLEFRNTVSRIVGRTYQWHAYEDGTPMFRGRIQRVVLTTIQEGAAKGETFVELYVESKQAFYRNTGQWGEYESEFGKQEEGTYIGGLDIKGFELRTVEGADVLFSRGIAHGTLFNDQKPIQE